MPTYKIQFIPSALKDWRGIDHALKAQLSKKLEQIAENPHIPSARMRGYIGAYRIKARSAGFRLIYQVDDDIITVFVIAIGKRERAEAFETGLQRLRDRHDD